MDYLRINDLKFLAKHGVFPEEQLAETWFTVDLVIGWNAAQAAATDELDYAIDYGKVYDLVAQEMAQYSKLIEHVAGRIQASLTAQFPQIATLETRLTKHRPPVVGDFGSVTIALSWSR